MVDFIQAFEEGKNAAKTVKDNNQEIESVFAVLNEQFYDAGIKIYPKGGFNLSDFKKSITESIKHDFKSPEVIDGAIYAKRALASNSSEKALVKWDKGREGYPCKITIGNKQYYCENKTELENALALMLKDPVVAGILVDLMRLSENQVAA